MFGGTVFYRGLCDRCDHHDEAYDRLVGEIAGRDVIDENGLWVGVRTLEKVAKLHKAMIEATARLTKSCVTIRAELDRVSLCRSCVERLLKEFDS